MNQAKLTQGFALMTVVVLVIVLMALATAYFFLTNLELSTTRANTGSATGFYAAEAGLNLRGEEIRKKFQGGDRPTGKLFTVGNACKTSADYTPQNSIDSFYCENYTVNDRKVVTYVVQDPANLATSDESRMVTLQAPDTFAGLNAIEYRYEVLSESFVNTETRPEARLDMVFRSRLIPVFQFATFYDKDLEIAPGADMTLNGRVHTNGDLYLDAGATLKITGKVTVASSKNEADGGGDLYRLRKNSRTCTRPGTVRIDDARDITPVEPEIVCSGRQQQSFLTPIWGDQIQTQMDTITAPEMETFEIGGEAWAQSDLRIALDVRGTTPKVIVPNREIPSGNPLLITENTGLTSTLGQHCFSPSTIDPLDRNLNKNKVLARPYTLTTPFSQSASQVRAAEGSQSFYDMREGRYINYQKITMLEIDIRQVIDCLNRRKAQFFAQSSGTEKDINDTSQGGLVIYLTVIGAKRNDPASGYGVRVRNGAQLKAMENNNNAPEIKGLTIVSDQALYIMGDYNKEGSSGEVWKPASFLVDSLNILSNAWDMGIDADSRSGRYSTLTTRTASKTQINAAFLAGTDTTGGREGISGQGGAYNGGLENYPRLHENWSNKELIYKGSFVSLEKPSHAKGEWPNTGTVYNAPIRTWSYDERFNDPDQLPPLAPRFVYLRQERFARDFTQ